MMPAIKLSTPLPRSRLNRLPSRFARGLFNNAPLRSGASLQRTMSTIQKIQNIREKNRENRACDACRRRKTKCDGPKMKDHVCSNCLNTHKSCTYLEASTPRGPPKAYVTGLEDRLEQLEALLKQVRPDADFTAELGLSIPRGSWKEEAAAVPSTSRSRTKDSPPTTTLRLSTQLALNSHSRRDDMDSDSSEDGFSSSDSEQMVEGLKGGARKFTLQQARSATDKEDGDSINTRFHGKSSLLTLVDITRWYRDLQISGDDPEHDPARAAPESFKRPEFWLPQPWELQWEGLDVNVDQLLVSVLDEYPPPSLATQLIDLYFIHCNSQLPLLHRPTFERQFRDMLHHRNIWFSCVCLSIFAIGSRWCNDPLVLPRNCARTSSGGLDWTCAGWHYHNVAMGIHRIRQSLLYPACLEEIQTFSLLAAFIRGTANHPAGWIFISIGMRKVQDVGAHRKKLYGKRPTPEDEMWKRAFWCLVAYDRFASAILGRPCACGEEDFDLDLCLEVDDEYWESEPPFRQPSGVPCRFTYFNLWLRLSQIVTFTVRTIYAVHNPRALLGRIAKVRTDEVIAQLTLALQDWLRSVPEHLRWSNHIKDEEFSNQSASLYTTYYLAEMLMYRAFIPPVQSASSPVPPVPHISGSFPALAFCINAARSSARIVQVQVARGWANIPILIAVSQLSAAILTLGVWEYKARQEQEFIEDVKPPLAQTIATLMDDIGVFIGALESVQSRWENVPNLIRVLKGALPKEDTDAQSQPAPSTRHPLETRIMEHPPPPPDPSSSHPHLHTFEGPHAADSDNWSLPFHSSSVRTRPIATHDLPHDERRSSYSMRLDDGVYQPETRRVPAAFDKPGHTESTWAPGASPTYAESPTYTRVHFNDPHAQDHSYPSL
ncbi:fungal-specific transcription factor domain-containing protein [Mycena capillaripes]|nr:fungal-specific transcription factor domain-containing protein [Mycena capillaripes]